MPLNGEVDYAGSAQGAVGHKATRSALAKESAPTRWELTPEKIEMVDGQLFDADEQRLAMLGMLLENLGADAAVRLGNPQVWHEAVKAL